MGSRSSLVKRIAKANSHNLGHSPNKKKESLLLLLLRPQIMRRMPPDQIEAQQHRRQPKARRQADAQFVNRNVDARQRRFVDCSWEKKGESKLAFLSFAQVKGKQHLSLSRTLGMKGKLRSEAPQKRRHAVRDSRAVLLSLG